MKKSILITITAMILFSCSADEITPETIDPSINPAAITYNKLKAYKSQTAFYSVINGQSGDYRIYLDTVNNIITQYKRNTNQSDTKESFGINKSVYYKNYNSTNVDFTTYEVNNYEVNNIITDNSFAPAVIMLSHAANTTTFVFTKFNAGNQIIFSNNSTTGVSYNKM
jgi:hypothetical protein